MTTGVVRRLDELGRIVIPKEIRKTLKIREGESLEILCVDEQVILKKHSHLADIKAILDSLLYSLTKSSDIDYLLVEKDRVVKTSRLFKDFEGTEVSSDLKEGIYKNLKINKSLEINTHTIIKPVIMYGDAIAKIIFIKEDIDKDTTFIDFLMNFLRDFLEK